MLNPNDATTVRRWPLIWMTAGGIFGVLVGLALIVVSLWPELGFEPVQQLIFGSSARPITPTARLATAVSGALTAGLSATAATLPRAFSPTGRPAMAAQALTYGVVLWFVTDSAASITLGATMNAAMNITLLLAILPPALWLGWMARSEAQDGAPRH